MKRRAQRERKTSPSGSRPLGIEGKPLSEDNKGAKLMRMMGWSGKGLGKNESGIRDPVIAEMRSGTTGLGSQATERYYS